MQNEADIIAAIKQLIMGKRPASSILLVGPLHLNILNKVKTVSSEALCEQFNGCRICSSCLLLQNDHHPDLQIIEPEEPATPIKIDIIREIQQNIYQTPKRGIRKIVIVNQADKMNQSASNALLKILEEPPLHTTFILITEQVNALLPTIRSRCQKLTFSDSTPKDFVQLGRLYGVDSSRGQLCQNADAMIEQLHCLIEGTTTPCDLALLWQKHILDDLLWWFGLFNCFLMHEQLKPSTDGEMRIKSRYPSFFKLIHPTTLFHLNDMVYAIRKKISHNITMNKQLVIEDILINFMESTHVRND